MLRLCLCLACASVLAGCESLGRDLYDTRAERECETLPNVDDRRACEAERVDRAWRRDRPERS